MAMNAANNNTAAVSTIGQLEPYKQTSSWNNYRERLEFYFEANGVLNDNIKRAIFLTMVGEETYEVIRFLFTPLAPRDVTYTEILERLDTQFNPIPNEIIQRYNFRKRYQRHDEVIVMFVTDLRKLSEHCNYTELDKELRDQIVCGVTDESLQRRLLAEPGLTFQRTFELAKSAKKSVHDKIMLSFDLRQDMLNFANVR